MKTIGVLSLQGGYDAHIRALENCQARAVKVKTWEEIQKIDALVIPGGESTTMGKLLVHHGLLDPLAALIRSGLPVFGTCAGLILLSMGAVGRDQPLLKVLDVTVERNAYGRQVESFETELSFEGHQVPTLFIRAPKIASQGSEVRVLARYEGLPVCVRQNRILAASCHPELTDSPVIHRYFLRMVDEG